MTCMNGERVVNVNNNYLSILTFLQMSQTFSYQTIRPTVGRKNKAIGGEGRGVQYISIIETEMTRQSGLTNLI